MANGQGHARVAHPGSSLSPPGKVRFLFHAANAREVEVPGHPSEMFQQYQIAKRNSPNRRRQQVQRIPAFRDGFRDSKRTSPENNRKIRPHPDRENTFVGASGGSLGIRIHAPHKSAGARLLHSDVGFGKPQVSVEWPEWGRKADVTERAVERQQRGNTGTRAKVGSKLWQHRRKTGVLRHATSF